MMTSKQRLLAALNRQVPDRLPVTTHKGQLSCVLQFSEYMAWVVEHLVKEKTDIDLIAEYAMAPACDVKSSRRERRLHPLAFESLLRCGPKTARSLQRRSEKMHLYDRLKIQSELASGVPGRWCLTYSLESMEH